MQTIAILLLLVAIAGSSFAAPQGCFAQSCLNRGDACPSTGICQSCATTLQTCALSNIANACACFGAFWTCIQGQAQCATTAITVSQQCSAQLSTCSNCTYALTATSLPRCSNADYCNYNTSTCTARHTSGSCSATFNPTECGNPDSADGLSYRCTSGTCASVAIGVTGDKCNGNGDCLSNTCTGGVCVAITGTCTSDGQCAVGSFCNAGLCTAVNAAGATFPIALGESGCGIGYTCGSGSVCVKYFSVAVGGNCDTRSLSECTAGAFCKVSNASLTAGVCTTLPASTSCSLPTDCTGSFGALAACACGSDGTGTCTPRVGFIPASCGDAGNKLSTCAQNSGCRFNFGTNANSCLYSKCTNEMNCFLNCQVSISTIKPCANDLTQTLTCKTTSSAAVASFGFFLLAALLFVATF